MGRGNSGSTSFEYEIERYKDKASDALILERDLPRDCTEDFEYELVVITLSVKGSASYTPGRYCGPPELCYPDECESELESVVDENGVDWEKRLTCREHENIMETIESNIIEGRSDDFDPPDSCDYPDDSRADYAYDPF